jgi:hypothetical protein
VVQGRNVEYAAARPINLVEYYLLSRPTRAMNVITANRAEQEKSMTTFTIDSENNITAYSTQAEITHNHNCYDLASQPARGV